MIASKLCLTAIAAIAAVAITAHEQYRPVVGEYRFSGPSLIDPDPTEQHDRVVIYLAGSTAKEVYDAMPQRPAQVECDGVEDSSAPFTKTAGGLMCLHDPPDSRYLCTFAVLLANGETRPGSVC